MVFEYIDGVTMTKLISLEKSKKIETNLIQKIDYLIQLASVIDFLHSHSLMHRDLKTDNIMIDHLGQVKLLDFGIAITGKEKWINMESPEYSLTPNYMAPEIAVQAQDEDDDDEINEDEEEEDDYNNDTQCKQSSSQQNNTLSSDYSDNSKKICETYHQQQSTLSSFNNIELPQYAQTEECKDGTSYCGKWILITNKYDIWTFGIIMAQLFTRCKPWCRSEKENISEMEAQNRLIANVPYPIHKLHPQEECKPYSKEIIHIIIRINLFVYSTITILIKNYNIQKK
jgi:serine/threonine protein kinase